MGSSAVEEKIWKGEDKVALPPKIIKEILKFNVRVTKKASVHMCLPDPATLCLSGFST